MKGYTVFNVEQIEGLPAIYYAKTTDLQFGKKYCESTCCQHDCRRSKGASRLNSAGRSECRDQAVSAVILKRIWIRSDESPSITPAPLAASAR